MIVAGRLAGFDLCFVLNGCQHLVRSPDIAGGAHADHAGVPPLGFERKEVVEGGYSVNSAGRELQLVGHKEQEIVLQISKQFLRLMKHFNQRVVLELMLLHVRLKNVETLVPAGVSKDFRQPVSVFLRQHRNHIAYEGLKSVRLLRWKQLN
ncbi:hypothetical protein SDC9_182342 [bioreactor metagenome]|uniref:Uncharacterized protein n=1 Tax=bioreactor metagenome TaxID=1076179 RepID=A0A645H7A2_9ZZZZ